MSTSKRSIMMPSMRTSSSIASSDDEDIESDYLSEHDDISCLDCSSSAGPREMVITMSKLTNTGKMPRRRSQCSQLSFRQHAYLSSASGDGDYTSLLPQTPPFSSTSTSSSSRRGKDPYNHQFPTLAVLTTVLVLIGITMFVVLQQHAEMTSLRSQLEIATQSRPYLEKSASDLHSTLKLRQAALNHCNQAHATTTRHNLEISNMVRTLRRELDESKRDVERLMEGIRASLI